MSTGKSRNMFPVVEKMEACGYSVDMVTPDKHEQTVLDFLDAIGVDVVSIAITSRKYNGEYEEYCDAIDITPAAAIAYLQMVEKILKDRFPFPATDEPGPGHYVEKEYDVCQPGQQRRYAPGSYVQHSFLAKRVMRNLPNTFLPPLSSEAIDGGG